MQVNTNGLYMCVCLCSIFFSFHSPNSNLKFEKEDEEEEQEKKREKKKGENNILIKYRGGRLDFQRDQSLLSFLCIFVNLYSTFYLFFR